MVSTKLLQNRVVSSPVIANRPAGVYLINEIFYSIQGEGRLSGLPMVFVRFSQCNLRCTVANAGFDCDTEFASYRELTLDQIALEVTSLNEKKGWVLLTGGEPGLQLDSSLIERLHADGWKIAIETNGSIKLPNGLDWICVSPKSADHTIRQRTANEVKCVCHSGMALPTPKIEAQHYLLSPAFQADGSVRIDDVLWCIELVKQNPQKWALTIQIHKLLGIR